MKIYLFLVPFITQLFLLSKILEAQHISPWVYAVLVANGLTNPLLLRFLLTEESLSQNRAVP
jgi:hypothetical protein